MYQALYRKWRPQSFSDMVGQDHVTKTLVRQVETERLSHAYLFTGTRGTGKTTCAKVLSKAVNCTDLKDGNPCNQCPSCVGIDKGAILDVVELDAASNNGVDQVRALRDEAVYTPGSVKKRVYIIDEVHMLSDQAENALLKILEEPPEHLLFILATTEQHKVMATIRSRCQQFTFKRILPQEISDRLTYISKEEDIPLSEEGAKLLARLADGGLRDGLSLLDQCRNSDNVDEDHILQVLGLAGNRETTKLMHAIATKQGESALLQLGKLYENGRDIGSVLGELSILARDLLLLKTAPTHGIGLLAGGYDQQSLDELGGCFTSAQLLYMLSVFQESAGKLSKSSHRRTDGELCLLRLCEPALEDSTLALSARIAKLEAALAGGGMPPVQAPPMQTAPPLQATPMQTAPPVQATPMQTAPPVQATPMQTAPPKSEPKPSFSSEDEIFDAPPPWLDENNVPDGLFAGFDMEETGVKPQAPPMATPVNQAPPMATPVNQAPPMATPMNQAPPMAIPVNQAPPMATPMNQAPPMATPMNQAPPMATPVNQAPPMATPVNQAPSTGGNGFWQSFLPKLQNRVPEAVWPYFMGQPSKVVGHYQNGILTLWVNQAFTKKRMEVAGCLEGVQAVAGEFFGKPTDVLVQIGAPPADNGSFTPPPLMAPPPPVVENSPPVTETPPPVMAPISPVVETAPPVVAVAPPVIAEAPPVETDAPPWDSENTPLAPTPPVMENSPPVTETAPPVMAEADPIVENTPPVAENAPPVETDAPPWDSENTPLAPTPPVVETAPPVAEDVPVAENAPPSDTESDPLDELLELQQLFQEGE